MHDVKTVAEAIRMKNGKELEIRKAVPEDAPKVLDYMNIVGGESDNLTFGPGELDMTVQQETEFIETIHAKGRSVMLLGMVGGEIAGITVLKCPERKRVCHNGDFSITVRKEYWGIGVGSALIGAIISHARNHGDIKNITLGARADNHKAIRLYEKHGFVTIGIQKSFSASARTILIRF